ncbi:hypothetical protein H6F86_13055 [Phormidium sp. FACHB-592]|uniref:Uncharacterized protein n=1 Tax=Stenomitos frigidus AS-A4 TaxID=2933935 RepID=A0ABV0KLW4_9CYAN|nr:MULTISPECIES: hypothetical protein [Cyanophyceae]MBD2034435.1 hypothetical protein [Leptolyngbya sp. FACHB-321]MBD2074803.1 hypothetical protein [Phormidium sp. FACHB-592]
MLNKLLRAVAITVVLSILIYNGFIEAKPAQITVQPALPPVDLKLTLP